ncbi:MAG: hypothetical protein IJ688_04515 [Treponema sp.]|uniref:hypothetical protein n=1 Tax=Treponema sp. TaxID=166 RepID=UPI0025D8EFB1|nr:hypothetical protein [Treponema sp.]MBQ8681197.1 hypothetical protein [Treponema sp.]MBR1638632.1 hypothetical protein [Treponema sp.]
MHRLNIIPVFLGIAFLFTGCPGEAVVNYPFWYEKQLDNLEISINPEPKEFVVSCEKNKEINVNFSGTIDSSEFCEATVLINFYKMDANENYEISDCVLLDSSGIIYKEGLYAFTFALENETSDNINKGFAFSFKETGKYLIAVNVNAPCKNYSDENYYHGVFSKRFEIIIYE